MTRFEQLKQALLPLISREQMSGELDDIIVSIVTEKFCPVDRDDCLTGDSKLLCLKCWNREVR